jgi:hypothetical protein
MIPLALAFPLALAPFVGLVLALVWMARLGDPKLV